METLAQIKQLQTQMASSIIGQQDVIERLLIGLLANGNLLIEGLPGLAKTRAIKALAKNIDSQFSRVQFTPDLLPSDITGSEVYFQTQDGGEFKFDPGPLFANIVLADEINRAPAKVQSALLEAMEERQITVAGKTHKMDPLFMVLATQNPVEQEGTYPLPEAQMDRFLMQVNIVYPSVDDEVDVIGLVRQEEQSLYNTAAEEQTDSIEKQLLPQQVIFDARKEIANIAVSPEMARYIADIVYATRTPEKYDEELASWIDLGASPRASISLDKCARTHAWLAGRNEVLPDDIRSIAVDVLRHRLSLSYQAQGAGIQSHDVIAKIIELVALP
ncbi:MULTISPECIES: AAA family ATPase [Pseudoalteromonas]|uniref:AAA family ATPase n=1 Tax=Pseudoalteromonas TaxID=53246 RepID=UPI00030D895D|nr:MULTISPECIES: MoxR family ATPase [Pseudoalteromonas]MCF6146603.1 MoxR-like ATPase [Pseudoalteromonas mariniglutinosa NCIMB 1770]TMN71003.1 MoxR family ATPase [Pseudoalteromonas sp. S1727]